MRLYQEYDLLATYRPGWSLTEIRQLTRREREWWLSISEWKLSLRANG